MQRSIFAFVLMLMLTCTLQAGKFNEKLSIGDAAPTYSGLPGVDGKKHSFADLKDKDVVVLVITCNHCPIAQDYEDRIVAFAKKYTSAKDSKVGFVAININTEEEDRLDKMKERAKSKGFTFPYLYDESQKIGRSLGATVTPEFFVFDKNRKVAYMGGMDNNADEAKVKDKYLEIAVEALLAGKKITKTETSPIGCSLKYLKKK